MNRNANIKLEARNETPGIELTECKPRIDFLRHIFNTIIIEKAPQKTLPNVVIEELKKRMARAEDVFKFSIYGGDPRRIIEFLNSDEWRDIVNYARSTEAIWILEESLEKLRIHYQNSCPEVAAKAEEALSLLIEAKETGSLARREQELSLEFIARRLKLEGFNAELVTDAQGARYVKVVRPLLTARIEIADGVIKYEVCRTGKTGSIEGLISALRRYEV